MKNNKKLGAFKKPRFYYPRYWDFSHNRKILKKTTKKLKSLHGKGKKHVVWKSRKKTIIYITYQFHLKFVRWRL